MLDDAVSQLEREGWLVLPKVLPVADCRKVAAEVAETLAKRKGDAIQAKHRRVVGGRNLLGRWDGWRRLLESPRLESFVRQVLGVDAGVVRILYFDKPPGQGWSLAMHQDRTIAVQQHLTRAAPFAKPTRKAGVPHVEATESLLRSMLTLRLHLDAMHAHNGPLVVAPGSHRRGAHEATSADSSGLTTIACDAGDVFAMRPLLSHGSLAATPGVTDHRRVLHLELSPSADLPGEYQWHQFVRLLRSQAAE